MSHGKFNDITASALMKYYTDEPAPEYRDQYHCVRQMIHEWNSNMDNKFSPT